MTGFIKDPATPGDIQAWAAGLGTQFNAQSWVEAFQAAGASYVIFYDKWIDGLVFHDTATTGFKTPRDFLREMADASHAAGLPLVIYWNAAYDDNPEFAQYATLDATGDPITFQAPWVCRLLSMHSPFRTKAQDQVREIIDGYRPIAGLWLDVYSQPWPTTDAFTTEAFRARYGLEPQDAAPGLAQEFVRDTLAQYLRELRSIAADLQPELCFTINGSAMAPMRSPAAACGLPSQLDFLSVEGHQLPAMDAQAAAASFLRRPMETGDLISASWFSPPPPMPAGRARRALAEAAVAWCRGANVYFAITPDYEGRFGGELQAIREAGEWLRDRRSLLAGSEPWRDVGVVPGAPAPTLASYPSLTKLWGMPVADDPGLWEEARGLLTRSGDLGYGGEVLWELGDLAAWPPDLSQFRALVVPERSCLGGAHVRRLREYVRRGGRLLVFGNGTRINADGSARGDFALADALGLRHVRPATFPPGAGPVVCYADSEYGHGWVTRNLADGTEAGWASASTPMPHWAQVNLPTEQPLAWVRVRGRQGGYLLRDLDVLTWNGAGWDLVRSFPANTEQVVDCEIDPPRTTLGVRVLVRAETYLGQARDLADIEEIELLGPAGKLLSGGRPYELKVELGKSLLEADSRTDAMAGPALIAEPHGAQVLATFADPMTGDPRPLVTAHDFGKGMAIWVATGSETAVRAAWFPSLIRLAVGRPTVRSAADPDRHRLILRRTTEGLLLCAVDAQPELAPKELQVRIDPEELALAGEVAAVADGPDVKPSRTGRRLSIRLKPDPAAVVLVR